MVFISITTSPTGISLTKGWKDSKFEPPLLLEESAPKKRPTNIKEEFELWYMNIKSLKKWNERFTLLKELIFQGTINLIRQR